MKSVLKDAPLGKESWFGCGGNADQLLRPKNIEELQEFLMSYPPSQPSPHRGEGKGGGEITILGGLANTIVRDGGIRGVTVQLGKEFSEIKVLGDYIEAGAGALNGSVAAAAVKAGIGGLEFLSGIPGCVGGALRMNAGAYGAEVKDVLTGVNAVSRQGVITKLVPEQLHMTYRHTDPPKGVIFTSAIFKGRREDYETVKARMNDIKIKRNETQPIREKTGGSTFANPPGELRAWQIVQKVGGHELKVGGAQMSPMHSNFMINTGDATATDLEGLGEEIRRRAHEKFGVNLRWEINIVGEKSQ